MRNTWKQILPVMVMTLTLFVCTIALAQEAQTQTPLVDNSQVGKTTNGNLTFTDPQQAWSQTEYDGYTEWLKRNPRYTHPILKSQYELDHPTNYVDDKPDPHYRGWRAPRYHNPNIVGLRGRILWVNDRYVHGKYYSSSKSQPAAGGAGQVAPKTEAAPAAAPAPAQGGSTALMPKDAPAEQK